MPGIAITATCGCSGSKARTYRQLLEVTVLKASWYRTYILCQTVEMSKISVIGLMLVTFSVSASLYSASTDYEQQKSTVLSDEAVAAYFKKKFETEDVKPAMVMEYLVKLMGSNKKGGDETSEYHSFNYVHPVLSF